MKKLLLIALLIRGLVGLPIANAQMMMAIVGGQAAAAANPISFVAGVAAAASSAAGSPRTLAYAGAVASGDLLVSCFVVTNGSTAITVSDSVNGAWSLAAGPYADPTPIIQIYSHYFVNSGAGTPTVTFSWTGGGTVRYAIAAARGMKTSAVLDAAAGANGTSSTPSSGVTATRAQANELLWACLWAASATTITAGTNFTIAISDPATPNSRIGSEYQIVSATGTDAGTFTVGSSMNWVAAVATFKGSS